MSQNVLFVYPSTQPYSGQTAATLLAINELSKTGWNCETVIFVGLDRSNANFIKYWRFIKGTFCSWFLLILCVARRSSPICFNHPQSLVSFFRMGLPHLLFRRLLPARRFVSSVHGNEFMNWPKRSFKMKFYLRILNASDIITVLGNKQLKYLSELGVSSDKLIVLPNCCDAPPLDIKSVKTKHTSLIKNELAPFVLLHLSLLIESKGFVKFLTSSAQFASNHSDRPIKVVLCGPLVHTSNHERFNNSTDKASWIDKQISSLNSLPNVTAEWIPGAIGAEKARLFTEAHCFVMPTRYPVEVQPLVLLEAMAAGCCIIASDQGEIPSTIKDGTGLCLKDISTEALSNAIGVVATDHKFRLESALAARDLSSGMYSRSSYRKNWSKLLA